MEWVQETSAPESDHWTLCLVNSKLDKLPGTGLNSSRTDKSSASVEQSADAMLNACHTSVLESR